MDGGGWQRPGFLPGGAGGRSIFGHVMLRFRPIAPKPADGEPLPGASTAAGPGEATPMRRVKRKYRVRARKKNNIRAFKTGGGSDVAAGRGTGSGAAETTTTLQLLPGVEEDLGTEGVGSESRRILQDLQEGLDGGGDLDSGSAALPESDQAAVVESHVTVESVGSASLAGDAGGLLGSTDVEKVRSLELDTCPAFMTDSRNRVRWLNAAYVALVAGGERACVDVRVEVTAKEELPWWRAAFTCQVRIEHTRRSLRYSKLVPCDVWRLDSGGFAWRLDVKAALSLGL